MNHRDRNCGLNSKLAGENRNRGLNSANELIDRIISLRDRGVAP